MNEINVAIADDNERILDLLGDMIDADKELKLVGKANNGEDAYEMIRQKQPDVVLLDLILPKMDGLSVMDQVNNDQELEKASGFYCDHGNRTGTDHGRCFQERGKLLYPETVPQRYGDKKDKKCRREYDKKYKAGCERRRCASGTATDAA